MSRRSLLLLFAFAAAAGVPFVASCGDEPQRLDTIVLVTVDTLRWDYVSCNAPEGEEHVKPRTPAIDGLAARAQRFTDARTSVPLTLPAHVTMLAGLPPAATGVRLNTYGRLPVPEARGYPLLPEALGAAGWTTGAFVSAAVLGKRYGLDQAFTTYDDGGLVDMSGPVVPERRGAETVAAALRWLGERTPGEPVFLWVHLFEPHAPYAKGSYAADVADADTIVGTLLDGLDAAGRGAAAVLLTSDHGEALGELRERSHGFLLADGVLRVPFLLRVPGRAPAARTDPADVADVAPTLAALAGVPWTVTPAPGCGIDLLAAPAPADRVRVAESVYGHQLHRWAQLVAAHGPSGTLVDAGRERLHWLPPSGWQRALPTTGTVTDSAVVRRLAGAIAQYKQAEVAQRIVDGQKAGGYGGGGPITPFLPDTENARLPDPHLEVVAHHQLDRLKGLVVTERLPDGTPIAPVQRAALLRQTIEQLDRLVRSGRLQDSPEGWFWIGEAWNRLGLLTENEDQVFGRAERAFLKSFELGRKDTETLVRACGANALGHEEAALRRANELVKQVPSVGCQFWLLRAALVTVLEERGILPAGSAEKACEDARTACRGPRHRAVLERTCR